MDLLRELRIGNLILLESPHVLPAQHVVTGQDLADIEAGRITLACLLPIELNYNLLVRQFKFVDYAGNGWGCRLHVYNDTMELAFYIQDGFMRYQTTGSGFTHNFEGNIKTVHQLQNLYFLLTSKELPYETDF